MEGNGYIDDGTVSLSMERCFELLNKAIFAKGWWKPPEGFKGPNDVYIATFAKSGTTWMQQICHQIRTGGTEDFENIGDEAIMLRPAKHQHIKDYEARASKYSLRCWKTHAMWHELAPCGGKFISVIRNPADVLNSFYNYIPQYVNIDTKEFSIIDCYFGYFAPAMDPQPYWNVLKEWIEHKDDPNVLIVFFEDLKKDLSASIDRIAKFMECSLTPEQKAKVLHYSSFEYMKENEIKFTDREEMEGLFSKAIEAYNPNEKMQHVSKIRQGKTGNILPTIVTRHIDIMWKVNITPMTGYDSYDSWYQAESALKK